MRAASPPWMKNPPLAPRGAGKAAAERLRRRIGGFEVFGGFVWRGLGPPKGKALQVHLCVLVDLRSLEENYLAMEGEGG